MKTQISALLGNSSTTFANINYTTKVATAAKFKAINITKTTAANVTLFANIKALTTVYKNAVIKSANNIDDQAIADFIVSDTYFEHTDCFSIVKHKTQDKFYLYAMFNHSSSEYFIDGVKASKQDVAAFLTPSAATTLLAPNNIVHNKTNDVLHAITIRTISLDNINSMVANKSSLTFHA